MAKFWIPGRVEFLRAIHADYSATEIGVMLGCTRNAVCGKMWRLGLGTADPAATEKRRRAEKRQHYHRPPRADLPRVDVSDRPF